MSARELDAVFYVSRVPEIAFRDEAFHVAYEVGRCRFEFAMPPNVFLKALRKAGNVSDAFRKGAAEVVDLPGRKRGH